MKRAVVFGGANMDIHCTVSGEIRMADSNIGTVLTAPGGVGRNIAENCARMGAMTTFVTALGDDPNGERIKSDLKAVGLAIKIIPAHNTPTYVCILNRMGELVVAVNHMDSLEQAMTVEALGEMLPPAGDSGAVVLDANLPQKALEFLAESTDAPIVFDPVSTLKCNRAQRVLGRIHTLKPNRAEAEALTGIDTSTKDGLRDAAACLLDRGVRRVFVTLGAQGAYFADETDRGFLRVPPVVPVNATGAGDAFTAALVYSLLFGLDLRETVRYACGASRLALLHETAVNPAISPEAIFLQLKKERWAYDDV